MEDKETKQKLSVDDQNDGHLSQQEDEDQCVEINDIDECDIGSYCETSCCCCC